MKDHYYPEYHFRPERNWMNDPNGLIYFEGQYHMFYQYNPNGDQWGTIHWGHAVSRDLIHWEILPLALSPSTDEGEIHCYSGCAVEYNGVPYLFYTSVGEGERGPENGAQQWSAVSHDGMYSFEKKGKPAISESLNGKHKIKMWRDPFLWREDQWYAVLGGTENGKGCLVLYSSKDLIHWEYKNKIYESKKYGLIECPNMIHLGNGKYLILYSPLDAVRYMLASLDRKNWLLHIYKEGIFDYSILKKGFYAPNTYLNEPNSRILIIGWISEADRMGVENVEGWAGMQSLPREIFVDSNETLHIRPAKECENLRRERIYHKKNFYDSEEKVGKSLSAEIFFKAIVRNKGYVELQVFADESGEEKTKLYYRGDDKTLILNRENSSFCERVGKEEISCNEEMGEVLELRIFLDHSSIEVFANERTTLTARVYPQKQSSQQIILKAEGDAKIEEVNIWQLGL